MKINYCKRCHEAKRLKNIEEVHKDIKKCCDDDVEITDKCASFCGPGKKTYFVTIDDDVIEADSYEELMQLIKEYYDEY